MSNSVSSQESMNNDLEGELILIFLTEYHSLEQALVRAGFTKARRPPGNVQPDWVRFARHIERRFHPGCSSELQEAVNYLLRQPGELELRRERLHGSSAGQLSGLHSDIVRLSELIQETAFRLIHGINFVEDPVYDFEYVTAALLVVAAWSCCDPRVESLLAHLQ